MFFSVLASIGFLLSHPNPSNHAKEFIKAYEEKGEECFVYTDSKAVANRFPEKAQIVKISTAQEIQNTAKLLEKHDRIIADISIPQWAEVFRQIKNQTDKIVYYDNPERFVSTAYSNLAQQMVLVSDTILFSNKNCVREGILNGEKRKISLSHKNLVGLGFYPQNISSEIMQFTKEQKLAFRKELFSVNNLEDKGQQILVIAGGASEEYDKTFLSFMVLTKNILQEGHNELNHYLFVLQQHPRSLQQGNKDGLCFQTYTASPNNPKNLVKGVISHLKTPQALSIADVVVYQQTSMAPEFILGGAPKVIQITHDFPNKDMLVHAGIAVVKTEEELLAALNQECIVSKKQIRAKLGIDKNWKENLP